MIIQEKINKKAERFGKLAPVFLEGAKFALSNQWISVEDDLPCNHEELIDKGENVTPRTIPVLIRCVSKDIYGTSIEIEYIQCRMSQWDGTGRYLWNLSIQEEVTHWMPIPKLPEE